MSLSYFCMNVSFDDMNYKEAKNHSDLRNLYSDMTRLKQGYLFAAFDRQFKMKIECDSLEVKCSAQQPSDSLPARLC